jgi:hypothetical protein
VPPEERVLPRFAAEPPQELLPYGRWAERLSAEFLGACLALAADAGEEELGEPGEIAWYPDRTWHGRTYIPASTITSSGYELFGYVRFVPGRAHDQDGRVDEDPSEFYAYADFTDETAERNPDWTLDLCEETIGSWRGHSGAVATMTLVWGRPLRAGGRVATAELADLAVDQCELIEERFTLIAPDDYRGDLLEIALFGGRGQELARESLYAGEDEDEESEDEAVTDEDDVLANGDHGGESDQNGDEEGR